MGVSKSPMQKITLFFHLRLGRISCVCNLENSYKHFLLTALSHTLVRALSNTKDMGRTFTSPQTHVDLHGALGINWEPLVRIDGNAKQARVGVNKLILVPNHRVPQDTSIIQVGQASHILRAVKLWRVNLANLILLEDFGLR